MPEGQREKQKAMAVTASRHGQAAEKAQPMPPRWWLVLVMAADVPEASLRVNFPAKAFYLLSCGHLRQQQRRPPSDQG